MKKERAVVYPYDIDFSPIIRHREMLCEYEIVEVVSPNGWGFSGRDCGFADGGEEVGCVVSNNFEDALERCDTVIFTESNNTVDVDKMIIPKIVKAIELNKNIVCTINLNNENYNNILKKCNEKNVDFKYYDKEGRFKYNEDFKMSHRNIFNIDTPIIFVLGLTERSSKFQTQLALRDKLTSMGYKVSQIGSRHYCEIMGAYSFPRFMVSPGLSESDKIILFNHYVRTIEREENPDVIIVGVPGGVMPISNKFNNRFGILAYEVCRAVAPDAVIFNFLYEQYDCEGFEKFINTVESRLGIEIDCCNIAGTKFEWNEIDERDLYRFVKIPSNYVNRKKEELKGVKTPIYNTFNEKDLDDMVNFVVDKLSSYEEVQNI